MVWAAYRALSGDADWLLASVWAWTFLGLTLVQRRFVGELAPFVAVFGGLGFVALLSWLELTRPPVPFRDREGTATAVARDSGEATAAGAGGDDLPLPGRRRAVALTAFGLVFTAFPGLYTAGIHGRVAIDDDAYRTARYLGRYAAERDRQYPRNYVLSGWGYNRMYNYFVSGQSASYAFAQRTYEPFLRSREPAAWYDRLRDRVGFVVTTDDGPAGAFGESTYSRLHERLGSGRTGTGVGHYRAVYADGDRRAFALVPGATLAGTGPAETTVTVTTDVSVPGATFEYTRSATTDVTGEFELTLAHPGTYRIEGGDRTVTVPEAAVREGETVTIEVPTE
jgi:dolichyl-diphosphooligosaccharide--protein glycosyltransferase